MERCINHPEVVTNRHCELCGQPFCGGCLEVVAGVGVVCAECEVELAAIPADQRRRRLDTVREEIRRSIPPARPWWGWRSLFWLAVVSPSLVAGVWLHDLYQYHQFLSIVSQEPILPGITLARLTDVGAAVERFDMAHGRFPVSLDDLEPDAGNGAELQDPYSPVGGAFRYVANGDGYRLCSVGPDRADDNGRPLDRFSGEGDICVGPLFASR